MEIYFLENNGKIYAKGIGNLFGAWFLDSRIFLNLIIFKIFTKPGTKPIKN